MIVAGVDEGDTEGSEPSVLGVALFKVTQASDELFAGDFFVVGEEIALSGLAGVVDEDVGVGSHASDGADHVAMMISFSVPFLIIYTSMPPISRRHWLFE